jgi:predicted regulator of Ras-like GTPase activity (Roadblock/LC7/MglB family)
MVDRLRELQASSPDIEASAVVSVDGLSIASALPQNVEEDRVSAMSAAMLSLGERIATELGRGSLEQVYIKGEKGYVILMSVGEEAVLTALAREQAKLGLIFLDMRRAAEDPITWTKDLISPSSPRSVSLWRRCTVRAAAAAWLSAPDGLPSLTR